MFQESHLQDIIRSGYVAATPRRIAFGTSVGLDQGPSFLQVWFYPHAASMRSLLGQTNPISFTFSSSVSAVASYDVL